MPNLGDGAVGVNVNLDALLEPTPGDLPCGPNLEYDDDFRELEKAANGTPELEFGAGNGDGVTRIEGVGPDWAKVRKLSEALFFRSKDLRVAVFLTRALMHSDGLAGLEVGLQLTLSLLERFWDHVHPMLDRDDNDDPTERINALAGLASEGMVGAVRDAWVVRSRQIGMLAVRDVEVAAGRLQPRSGAEALSEGQVIGLITAGLGEDPGLALRVRKLEGLLKSIDVLLSERVGAGDGIDFKPLQTVLYPLRQFVERCTGGAQDESAHTDATLDDTDAASAGPLKASASPGEIHSRTDVLQTLDRLCDFLARTEPGSPVPMVLRRAQKMMNMNFLELMNDLAPDGLGQAEKVVGARFEYPES